MSAPQLIGNATASGSAANGYGASIGDGIAAGGVFRRFAKPWRLPLIAVFDNQQIGVITRRDNHDNISIQFSGDEGLETTLNVADIEDNIVELALLRPLSAIPDARVDDYIRPYQANWFWSLSLKDWRRYGDIMLASLVANVLALAGMIFSMQVYDRVVPAQSYPTLWVLFAGVMMAIAFEFSMRMVRTHISDMVGKRADLRISDRVFGHALRLKTTCDRNPPDRLSRRSVNWNRYVN